MVFGCVFPKYLAYSLFGLTLPSDNVALQSFNFLFCYCCIFPQMSGQLYLLSAPSLYSQIALQYQTLTPPPPKIGIPTEANQFLKSLVFSKFNCFQTGQPACWFWQLHKALSLVIFINSDTFCLFICLFVCLFFACFPQWIASSGP